MISFRFIRSRNQVEAIMADKRVPELVIIQSTLGKEDFGHLKDGITADKVKPAQRVYPFPTTDDCATWESTEAAIATWRKDLEQCVSSGKVIGNINGTKVTNADGTPVVMTVGPACDGVRMLTSIEFRKLLLNAFCAPHWNDLRAILKSTYVKADPAAKRPGRKGKDKTFDASALS